MAILCACLLVVDLIPLTVWPLLMWVLPPEGRAALSSMVVAPWSEGGSQSGNCLQGTFLRVCVHGRRRGIPGARLAPSGNRSDFADPSVG